jgi:hypothetical protein
MGGRVLISRGEEEKERCECGVMQLLKVSLRWQGKFMTRKLDQIIVRRRSTTSVVKRRMLCIEIVVVVKDLSARAQWYTQQIISEQIMAQQTCQDMKHCKKAYVTRVGPMIADLIMLLESSGIREQTNGRNEQL